jgi:hypothetical protein
VLLLAALAVGVAAVALSSAQTTSAAPSPAGPSAQAPEVANPIASLLGQARRFAVFHGVEAGRPSQPWRFDKSYLWGDIGVGPGVRTEFKSDSTVIGDCYEQPGQAAGKGCADITPHRGSPVHQGPDYRDFTGDLSAIVQDIRTAVSTVSGLPATQTLERITGGATLTSPACGTVNVIRVRREVNVGGANQGIIIQGCATDSFIFDVGGQWASSGGRVRLNGVPASNVLWVFKGRLHNSGKGGWAGTAIFDTANGADNDGKDLTCTDCALLVLNGKLSLTANTNLRWHPFTTFDYGDAPESYGTLYSATTGAARHKFTPNGPWLGTAWDAETDGQPVNRDGSDEDGLGTSLPLIVAGQTDGVELTVSVTNPSGADATLACWIDFNRDGLFSADERAWATVSNSSDVDLTFSDFGAAVAGPSALRCRISTDGAAVAGPVTPIPPAAPAPGSSSPRFPLAKPSYLANDGWPDGEVEDYLITIESGGDAAYDFGDAPDGSAGTGEGNYRTRKIDIGPRHIIVEDLMLGSVLTDLEWGDLENVAADADDTNYAIDDEDAIPTLPQITAASMQVQLDVVATNLNAETNGVMQCWIDFNRNGDFADQGEASGLVSVAANSAATYPLSFTPASAPSAGVSYIRCRIAYDYDAVQISTPYDLANSGEVEDHRVVIQP